MGRHLYWNMNSIQGFESLSGFVMKMFTLSQNCNLLLLVISNILYFSSFIEQTELWKQT